MSSFFLGSRLIITRIYGADDPLLFRSRLTDQYAIARSLGLDDAALADLARGSIRASLASPSSKRRWLAQVDA